MTRVASRLWAWIRRMHLKFIATRGMAYSIAFLFALSFLLAAGSYFLSVQAIRRATANTATITQLCMTGNDARAQQIQLWEFVISVSRPPHETAAHRRRREATVRRFTTHLHRVFAPRNCTKGPAQ